MHKHDPDLIAAFADGSNDNEIQARALIESCAECRAEYENQVRMIAMLRQVPPVTMTDREKAAMRRDLWTELRSDPIEEATAGSPWWYRWSYAAAGLVIVVGIAAGLGNVIGNSTQTAASFSEIGSGLGSDTGQPRSYVGQESAGGSDSAVDQPQTTTTAAATAEGPISFDTLAADARLKVERSQLADAPEMTDEIESCLTTLGLEGQTLVERVVRDKDYLVTATPDEDPTPSVVIITVEPCEVVYTDS
ncbi:MAG: hypothetical protein WB245_07845 [Acidimicrobiia bacterium]